MGIHRIGLTILCVLKPICCGPCFVICRDIVYHKEVPSIVFIYHGLLDAEMKVEGDIKHFLK